MSGESENYYLETRHPWPNALFVVPLVLCYELGIFFLGGVEHQSQLRNGADTWLQWLLGRIGLAYSHWPGILLISGLLFKAWWDHADRPTDIIHVYVGMAVECVLLAVALLAISRGLSQVIAAFHLPLSLSANQLRQCQLLVSYLGAGIYEEMVFRLLLFGLLYQLLKLGQMTPVAAVLLAMLISSLLFSGAHHLGPSGEAFGGFVFLFRTVAGAFFALVYQLRGFGIAVGSHAFYDILVGIILPAMM